MINYKHSKTRSRQGTDIPNQRLTRIGIQRLKCYVRCISAESNREHKQHCIQADACQLAGQEAQKRLVARGGGHVVVVRVVCADEGDVLRLGWLRLRVSKLHTKLLLHHSHRLLCQLHLGSSVRSVGIDGWRSMRSR